MHRLCLICQSTDAEGGKRYPCCLYCAEAYKIAERSEAGTARSLPTCLKCAHRALAPYLHSAQRYIYTRRLPWKTASKQGNNSLPSIAVFRCFILRTYRHILSTFSNFMALTFTIFQGSRQLANPKEVTATSGAGTCLSTSRILFLHKAGLNQQ